ncbi:MAG: hypothetical protein ACFFB5_15000 [Promethearchaeota archaeon]
MIKLQFKIVNEFEISENAIVGWLKSVNEYERYFLERKHLNRRNLGNFGEFIGKFILEKEFILYQRKTSDRKMIPWLMFEKENVLLDSYYLANLFSNIEDVSVKSNIKAWLGDEKFLSLREHTGEYLGEISFEKRVELGLDANNQMICWKEWKKKTLRYGPFIFTFKDHILEDVRKSFIDYWKRETGAKLTLTDTLGVPFEYLIKWFFPEGEKIEYQKWREYLYKRVRYFDISSFLAKNTQIDVNDFICTNKVFLDLDLDVWGIPKENSDFFNKKYLYAIDYKSHRIKCVDHGKYQTPALYFQQRNYVKSLILTQIGVLILSLQFCDCGRIFCKYLVPMV